MHSYRYSTFAILLATPTAVLAQNFFGSLVSDVTSVYGQVTSIFGDTSTGISNSATQTSSNEANTSVQSSSNPSSSPTSQSDIASTSNLQTSSSSTPSSITSSASRATGSSVSRSTTSAASSSATSSASGSALGSGTGSGHNSQKLGIILGCVFGILALILLILLFICCRRRRRSRRYFSDGGRTRSLSPNEKGSTAWFAGAGKRRSRSSSRHRGVYIHPKNTWSNTATAASPPPLEKSHTFKGPTDRQNPFVPMPPPPRRKPVPEHEQPGAITNATPHSAVDRDHGILPSQNGHTASHDNFSGTTLAAGAGGAMMGGLAAHAVHQHNANRELDKNPVHAYPGRESNTPMTEMPNRTETQPGGNLAAVPSPEHRYTPVDARESEHNEALALAGASGGLSRNSSRSRRRSWSYSRENLKLSDDAPAQAPEALLAAAGTGAAASAIVAHHRHHSKSPHRKGILKQTGLDSSSSEFEDHLSRKRERRHSNSSSHYRRATESEIGGNIPAVPPTRDRGSSPLGTAAPIAAAGSYINENPDSFQQPPRYSISGSNAPPPPVPPIPAVVTREDTRRHTVPSAGSSRASSRKGGRSLHISGPAEGDVQPIRHSTDRQSFQHVRHPEPVSPVLYPYHVGEGDQLVSPVSPVTASQPGTLTQSQAANAAGLAAMQFSRSQSRERTGFSSPSSGNLASGSESGRNSAVHRPVPLALDDETSSKSIVGDNGYPHHNIPRRMSGGEYDFNQTGPLGPQVVQALRHGNLSDGGEVERSSSDDSAFRLSSGTPGSWGHSERPLSRRSGESSRYPPRSYNNSATPKSARSRSSSQNSRHSKAASLPPIGKRVSAGSARPGYGFGSGDPFDLATMRTDSNMTGYSVVPPAAAAAAGTATAHPVQFEQGRRSLERSNSATAVPGRNVETAADRYDRLNRELHSDQEFYHGNYGHDVGRAY